MKKTLFTLACAALVAPAFAAEDPLADVTHTGLFPDNAASLTSGNQDITFGTDAQGQPLTLTSWMIEFTLTKDEGKSHPIFAIDKATPEQYGLGFYYWGGNGQYSFSINGAEKHADTVLAGENFEVRSDGDASYCIQHLTMPPSGTMIRLAYDNGTAYLYVNETLVSRDVSTLAANQVTLKSGDAHFWTWQGGDHFSNVKVTDLSLISGNSAAIQTYMMTRTPEPATATLSLLALAGLVARRRRH